MTLEYWYMFPISIIIATIAMASGVEGATFFTPLFILAFRLSPEIAIGTGLIAIEHVDSLSPFGKLVVTVENSLSCRECFFRGDMFYDSCSHF